MTSSLTKVANTTNASVAVNLSWSPMAEVIGVSRMAKPLDKLKYLIRLSVSKNLRNHFLRQISQHNFGRTLFTSNPNNFYVPLRSYLDNRFSMKERFEACITDIETAKVKFGVQISENLILGSNIKLFDVGQFSLHLHLNRVSQFEGFWALSIKDEFGISISNLSFGFLDQKTVLIASVQGIKSSSRNVLALNKQLTKDVFGLRPPNLLIASIQSLCQIWQIENLLGIDPKNQVKRKVRSEKQGFIFNYSQFWNELGGFKNFSGYWNLSNKPPTWHRRDIPCHKRSQYKKRNLLIERMTLSSTEIFQNADHSTNIV